MTTKLGLAKLLVVLSVVGCGGADGGNTSLLDMGQGGQGGRLDGAAGSGGTDGLRIDGPGDRGASDGPTDTGGADAPLTDGQGGQSDMASSGGADGPAVDGPAGPNPLRQLDLIFLIDNSSSMAQEQANLSRNFPVFMRELENITGGLPDTRIGVISSNFGAGPGLPAPECPVYGDRGAFIVKQGCGLNSATQGFWLSVDGKGNQNFTGDLPSVFACMASLGTTGCGYEHQLQSLRAALAATDSASTISPQNRGFLRRDAFLGIVILSDEDDCSGEPTATLYQDPIPGQAGSLRCATTGHVCGGQPVVAAGDFRSTLGMCKPYERQAAELTTRLINVKEFVDFIKAIKGGNEDKILVSSIIGWAEPETAYGIVERPSVFGGTELDLLPVCSQAETGSAAPGVRLHQFTTSFRNNTVHAICQADLSAAMKQIGEKLALVLGNTSTTTPLVTGHLD